MQSIRCTLLPLILLFLAATPAHALFRVGLLGGAGSTSIKTRDNFYSPDGLGFSGGLAAELRYDSWGLEFDAIYASRKVQTDITTMGVTSSAHSTVTSYHFPLLARAWLANIISLGAGLYYTKFAKSSGEIITAGHSTSYSASIKDSDVGLVTSVAVAVPFAPFFSFIVDGRYNHGFKKSALREAQFFLGPQFNL